MTESDSLDRILGGIDISPTMYKNAVEKYEAVGRLLNDSGIECEVYPQGSFRTGTVVRPLRGGKEQNYDIDLVCEVRGACTTDPRLTRERVLSALQKSGVYADILDESDRCLTLNYADCGGVGFLLDVVPARAQGASYIEDLIEQGVDRSYAEKAITLPERISECNFRWLPSNPEGFALWFDRKNQRFKDAGLTERRKRYFEANKDVYAAIEDVPELLDRSTLQRSIQILKRSRDQFYEAAGHWGYRPISAILVSLSARIAQATPTSLSTVELLAFIASRAESYSRLLSNRCSSQVPQTLPEDFISFSSGKWRIENPVCPDDNYADSWSDDHAIYFFRWMKAIANDAVDLSGDDRTRNTALDNIFGHGAASRFSDAQIKVSSSSIAASKVKPWGV